MDYQIAPLGNYLRRESELTELFKEVNSGFKFSSKSSYYDPFQ
ncbi:hypothetical protein DYBT9623_00946 [Dyadobacter sp. CECT 9623]|uniref:Uncharacterized protein n=1 Tax=Dyadobacter linearis TaxID=2823330 RepID=A0ABM8UL61_9BACT|nr:hypothetical protein DYBT9623_00946 [Dyadobacter sp. CECT 9623]